MTGIKEWPCGQQRRTIQKLCSGLNRGGEPLLRLINGALGLSGESGEVADHIKKHIFQGHELDREFLAKELGDICWYIAVAAQASGYPLEDVMRGNVEKLRKRYPNGFEEDRSIHRDSE